MIIAYVELYILDGVKNPASGANRNVFVCTPTCDILRVYSVLELPGGRGDVAPTAIACPRHWLYSWRPRGGQHLSLALVRNFVAA